MKKLLIYILLSVIISLTMGTIIAHAVDSGYVPTIPKPSTLPGLTETQQLEGTDQGSDLINKFTTSILPKFAIGMAGFIGGLSLLFIVIGGVRLATSYGNEEAVTKAIQQIEWAIVGFIIVLMGYTIVSLVVNLDFT
jgi:hypothetical protein